RKLRQAAERSRYGCRAQDRLVRLADQQLTAVPDVTTSLHCLPLRQRNLTTTIYHNYFAHLMQYARLITCVLERTTRLGGTRYRCAPRRRTHHMVGTRKKSDQCIAVVLTK